MASRGYCPSHARSKPRARNTAKITEHGLYNVPTKYGNPDVPIVMISIKLKNWEEKDAIIISDNVKTTTVIATFEAVKGATGTLTSVWAMHYTEGNTNNPSNSKAVYTGYTVFKGAIEKDGKELNGTIVMSDNGEYDAVPTVLHSKVVAAYDDLKHITKVSKSPRGGSEEGQIEFDL